MTKPRITVVIPNYNGINYIEDCLDSLLKGTLVPEIIVVDNASTDGSMELVRDRYTGSVTLLRLRTNTGFCHAVNSGIHITRTDYVFLLNNDTRVAPDCVEKLLAAIDRSSRTFSVQAKMLSMSNPDVIDGTGDLYCGLGWAFARGKGKAAEAYSRPDRIFSACAGAAVYRVSVFEEIGYFDERHYCYLEDVDIGWRAQIYGYANRFEPSAVVYHAGSAASGSAHNAFKEVCTAGNNRYLLWKNMPALQWILNWPLTRIGVSVKRRYFAGLGLSEPYENGLMRGDYLIELAKYEDTMRRYDSPEKRPLPEEAGLDFEEEADAAPDTGTEESADGVGNDGDRDSSVAQRKAPLVHPLYLGGKVRFELRHLPNYFRIQWQLWCNIGKRMKSGRP